MHWTKIRSGASICKKPNQEVTVLLPGCMFEKSQESDGCDL